MNTALIIIYVLVGISLLIAASQHGKPQEDYNFWISFTSKLINLTLIWWALGWKFI